jgi:hypothetical protein
MSQPISAISQQIDAINLMLHDLGLMDEALQHRASFHGCSRELLALRQELRDFLMKRRPGAVAQRTNSISW